MDANENPPADRIARITGLAPLIEHAEEGDQIMAVLQDVGKEIEDNPGRIDENLLAVYKNLAAGNDYCLPIGRQLSFAALDTLRTIALRRPTHRESVIAHLSDALFLSRDKDICRRVLDDLGGIATETGLNLTALAVIECVGCGHEDPLIRTRARRAMIETAEAYPSVMKRAIAVVGDGATDPDPEARAEALKDLITCAQSPACSSEDLWRLQTLLTTIAGQVSGEDQDAVANGLQALRERRRIRITGPSFP